MSRPGGGSRESCRAVPKKLAQSPRNGHLATAVTSGASNNRRRLAGSRDYLALALGYAAALEALLLSKDWLLGHLSRQKLPGSAPSAPVAGLNVSRLGEESFRFLLFVLVFIALGLALRRVGSRRLRLTRVLVGVDGLLVLSVIVAAFGWGAGVPPLMMPLAACGLWVLASFGLAPALLVSLALTALLGMLTPEPLALWALLLRAVVPVLMMRKSHRARTGFVAAAAAGAFVALVFLAEAATSGQLAEGRLVASYALLGGLFDGVLFVVGRTSAESALGHVSRERLHELLDLKQPLLCRMMEKAPGSFEHSRAMANLAEQAASAIGADALLTRVGAYYHDLGKSCQPNHFVENLVPGQISPHDALAPLESARRIQNHVTQGVLILRRGGIPEPVVEFAYTHHGTQRVEYFLNKQRELCEESGEVIDEEAFRYPGMKPMTRETAILMLVDSIEAASRTLDRPEKPQIDEMLRRIVFTKLSSGQLDDSGLTMKELRLACDRVVWTLLAMNHHRIKYPWQEEQRKSQEAVSSESEGSPSARRPLLSVLAPSETSEKLLS